MVEVRNYLLEGVGVTVSVLLSIIVVILSRSIVEQDNQLSLLIGITSLLIGLLITNYVNSEKEFSHISDEIDDVKRKTSRFHELEEHPEYKPHLQRIVSNFIVALNGHEFFQQRAEESLYRLDKEMQDLADGRFRCDADIHMEPKITRDLLEETNEYIKAVSYGEENWWLGDSGRRYMNRHEQLMEDKDVEIFRIFITPTDLREEMADVFNWHDENGIYWDVLDPEEFPTTFLDKVGEFVIYDGELLREGEPTKGQLENKIVVTTSVQEIRNKLGEFRELLTHTELEVST